MSKAATKALIDEKITGNGVQAITGPILNNVLNTMVDDYGTQDEVSQLAQEVTDDVSQLEAKVDALNDILDVSSSSGAITADGSVASRAIDSYGEIIALSATSYIIAYVQVANDTKIRVQHSINGPSSAVGIYGYVDSVEDIVLGTFVQGKGGTRTTSGSYDETIDVPAGKVFVLSTQTSKCTYTLTDVSSNSAVIDGINSRLSSLEQSTQNIEGVIGLGVLQSVESLDSTASSLYIDSSEKFATAGSSAYVIFYKEVFEDTKFRIVQTISSASYALGKIGYVNSVSDIANGNSPTMLKTTSATTGNYDSQVAVPAGKILVISGCTTASKYTISIYRLRDESIFDSLQKYPRRGVNLIQSDAIRDGFRVDNTTGMFTNGTGYCAFEVYFPKDKMRLYTNGVFPGYYIIFDKNGNVLDSGSGISSDRKFYSGYVLPDGAYRGRFSANDTKANFLTYGWISYHHGLVEGEMANRVSYEQSYTITKPEVAPTDYIGRDMSTFRKVCCIGDSLTAGAFNVPGGTLVRHDEYSYPTFLAKISGTDVVNMGDSGESAVSWWNTYKDDARLSDIDCAIIQLGVNDPIDTWDTLTNPALINIVNKLKANNTGIIIFFAGIINGKSYPCAISTETYYAKDQKLRTLYESEWASDDQVFFIDWAKWGHLRDLKSEIYTDANDNYNNGHLSAYGYNRLAQDYYNYIGWIMHNDDQKFSGIQFIESPE